MFIDPLTNRTDEVVVLAKDKAHAHGQKDGGNAATDEALPGLFGAQLDQGGLAQKEAEHVGHDVIHDNHQDGQDEPNETLEHVLNDQVGLGDHDQQGYVGPGKERELPHVVTLDQGQDEPDKANDVPDQRECKWCQDLSKWSCGSYMEKEMNL